MKLPLRRAACILTLSCAAATAQAATTALGTLETDTPNVFNGVIIPAGTFNDIFTFTLPENLGSAYSVINFPVSGGGVSFNTVLSTLSLVANPDGIIFNGDDTLVKSSVAPGGSELELTFGPGDTGFATTGGNFYINVTGLANGATGGLYSGAISVTPIPEPEVWAMMLIGAGLVGFRLRHRSRRAGAARFA